MKKLNITFCSFPDFAGNAKALYEYMVKTYKDKMNYTWIVYNQTTVDRLKSKGIKAILIGSDEFEKYIPKTNVFFTTHANLAGDKEKCKNAIYIELWHGVGPKPVGFVTKKLSKEDSKWCKFLSYTIDYIVVPSPFFSLFFSSAFKIDPNRILSLGLPILDEIVYSKGKNNLKKIFGNEISKYNKYIFYAPTFKLGCGRDLESNFNRNNILNLEKYDEKKLISYLHKNNYLLFIKYHPSDEINYKKVIDDNIIYINNEILEKNHLNINEILNAFDLLITDYSSLGCEFSFLDKPVIYLSTDYEEYKNNRGIILDDYDFWTDKIACNNLKDLLDMLNKYVGKKRIISNKKQIFSDLVDGGCKQICDYFFTDNKINRNIKVQKNEIGLLESHNKKLTDEINNLKEKIKVKNERIKYLEEKEQELASIKYSRSYKVVKKISDIGKKVTRK